IRLATWSSKELAFLALKVWAATRELFFCICPDSLNRAIKHCALRNCQLEVSDKMQNARSRVNRSGIMPWLRAFTHLPWRTGRLFIPRAVNEKSRRFPPKIFVVYHFLRHYRSATRVRHLG